jgi:hypothetical protein
MVGTSGAGTGEDAGVKLNRNGAWSWPANADVSRHILDKFRCTTLEGSCLCG